ncbi:hypothetical protein [Halobacteriovorax sp. HLS]|uniref:hypothetical protein n=1 Tax=Halobacteriovorax sp. HLS TaxID=2234000 RepID=UPI000FDA571E|nr:hypothetical protein [Halobacteriovorax sp. HLS]
MKSIFIYLCFITNTFALFQTHCGENTFEHSQAYVIKERSITCEKIDYFQSIIKDISNFFEEPPFVRLFIGLKSSNASFDYGESINIPLQLVYANHYGSEYYPDSNLSEYILAHEYGHAIFTNLLKNNEFYREIYLVDKQVSKLEFKRKIEGSLEEDDQLRLADLTLKKRSFNKVRRLLNDYSEFFSDVVAVYYANDKEVMVDALYSFSMSDQQFSLAMARSFSEREIDIEDRLYTEEHASLVLVRQFVGKNFWPKTDDEKTNNLKLIFKSIEQEILLRLRQEEFRLNPKIMNERLIKRIENQNF